jgi:hypothetical protein
MSIDTYLAGRAVGFGHAHPEDAGLHAHLLTRTRQLGRPLHELTYTAGGARLLGEISLARTTARWVQDNEIDVLVTPARDHVEHMAAAHIGRLAAVVLRGQGYSLDLLELQLTGREATDSLWVKGRPECIALAGAVAATPLAAPTAKWRYLHMEVSPHLWQPSDHHQSPAEASAYRLLPADQVAVAPNELALLASAPYAILNR